MDIVLTPLKAAQCAALIAPYISVSLASSVVPICCFFIVITDKANGALHLHQAVWSDFQSRKNKQPMTRRWRMLLSLEGFVYRVSPGLRHFMCQILSCGPKGGAMVRRLNHTDANKTKDTWAAKTTKKTRRVQ